MFSAPRKQLREFTSAARKKEAISAGRPHGTMVAPVFRVGDSPDAYREIVMNNNRNQEQQRQEGQKQEGQKQEGQRQEGGSRQGQEREENRGNEQERRER